MPFPFRGHFCYPISAGDQTSTDANPLIVAGLLCYALVSVAFVFSRNVEHLIVIRFLQGIASAMIMPVVQAYVGDITPPGREGFTMGLFNMSMFMGLSAGPLIGGLINDHFSLKIAFVCMGILALVGFFSQSIHAATGERRTGFSAQTPSCALACAIERPRNIGSFFFPVCVYPVYRHGMGVHARF